MLFTIFGYFAAFSVGFLLSFFLHRKLVSDMAAMKNDAIATLKEKGELRRSRQSRLEATRLGGFNLWSVKYDN